VSIPDAPIEIRVKIVYLKKYLYGAIIIKADSKSNKILSDLAKKLGANVLSVRDEQFEDFALGSLMDAVKQERT